MIEHHPAVLTCYLPPQHPDNPETIMYTWTKDGRDIGFNNQTSGRIETSPVTRSDTDSFVCTVRNVAGVNSVTASLVVYCKNNIFIFITLLALKDLGC